jgi:cysteine desulfurase
MPLQESIYLDHAATTPLHPQVLEAMLPYLTENFGNPSSMHQYGRRAKAALTDARHCLAQSLGCSSQEVIFTSGGTESNNAALFGAMVAASPERKKIVTSSIEHHAILRSCDELKRRGIEVSQVSVDGSGRINLTELEQIVDLNTAVVSIMLGNNEVGTLQPIVAAGQIAKRAGALFHVDAVQALGHIKLDLSQLPVDLMSFSAHKINGPKGIGALYIDHKARWSPMVFGGSQERNRRAGTENIAGAVGFATAVQCATENIDERIHERLKLRQTMLVTLHSLLPAEAYVLNGHPTEHLPHILHLSFPGTEAQTLLMNLDLAGIAASSGSACSSGALEPSHVLQAMNLPHSHRLSAIRFSFGYGNCLKTVTIAAEKVATIVRRLTYK